MTILDLEFKYYHLPFYKNLKGVLIFLETHQPGFVGEFFRKKTKIYNLAQFEADLFFSN